MATGVEQLRCGRPAEAVRTARKVARLIRDPVLRAIKVGGFLIDAGADLKKVRLVKEAVDELEGVSAQVTEPNQWAYHFNLGNGYSALGHRQKGRGPSTKPAFVKAISHLDEALKRNPAPDVRANLGGALLAQGRWIEAFDESDAILQEFPTHHKALVNRALSLRGIYHWVEGHTAILAAALSDIEYAVKLSQNEPVFQSSYKKTLAESMYRQSRYLPRLLYVVTCDGFGNQDWRSTLARCADRSHQKHSTCSHSRRGWKVAAEIRRSMSSWI